MYRHVLVEFLSICVVELFDTCLGSSMLIGIGFTGERNAVLTVRTHAPGYRY